MEIINSIFSVISGMGKYLMVPLMVSLIALAFKAPPFKALKGGIYVGIGLMGLDLALSLVSNYLGPVATALVGKANLQLDVIDVGWPPLAGIAYATTVGAFIIPFILLINILLLSLGATKTMDIDIWNYWSLALVGSIVYFLTEDLICAFAMSAFYCIVTFSIADRTAEQVQHVIGIPGISIPHGGSLAQWFVAIPMEKLWNMLSKSKDEKAVDRSKVEKARNSGIMKVINEPAFLGFIMGSLLAFVSGQDVKSSFTTGMAMAALMVLLPKMVSILMEGLNPVSEACQAIMAKRYAGEKLYIGMDSAVCLGHTTTMLGAVIMIPIAILIAMLLPGNRIIPMASLASIGYNVSMCTVAHKGKVIRTMVSGIICLCFCFLAGSYFAPVITKIALSTGYEMADSFTLIGAPNGPLFLIWPFYLLFGFNKYIGLAVCLTGSVLLILINRRYFRRKRDIRTTEFTGANASDYLKKQ